MPRVSIFATAGIAVAMLAVPASAQRWNDRGWRTIAYKTVNGRDTDTIKAPGRINWAGGALLTGWLVCARA